ncbi:MAG: histidine phosphatase family protein [Bacteroidetes bacterium]|nr:histidine phosphatase family protein [Bacteroidota bacterium]
MKNLYIVRHAKSSWKEAGRTDFERSLNTRGLHNAPFMGRLLAEQNVKPDIILSSPAKRAITTARLFSDSLGYPLENIVEEESIYEAGINSLVKVINGIPDKYNIAMIFGHNPGLTIVTNYMCDKYIDNIPTCGIVKIELNVDSWNDVADECGKIISFDYPKRHLGPQEE